MKCGLEAHSKSIDIKCSNKQNPLCIFFSTQLKLISFSISDLFALFTNNIYLLILQMITEYFLPRISLCSIISIFLKSQSSYFPAKTAHGRKDLDWHCIISDNLVCVWKLLSLEFSFFTPRETCQRKKWLKFTMFYVANHKGGKHE